MSLAILLLLLLSSAGLLSGIEQPWLESLLRWVQELITLWVWVSRSSRHYLHCATELDTDSKSWLNNRIIFMRLIQSYHGGKKYKNPLSFRPIHQWIELSQMSWRDLQYEWHGRQSPVITWPMFHTGFIHLSQFYSQMKTMRCGSYSSKKKS